MMNTKKVLKNILGDKVSRNKESYIISYDDTTGLWYAIKPSDTGFGWRDKSINLGYPKKRAYEKARELGLI